MTLTATDLKRVFALYQRMLQKHRQALDTLNVYPSADGNTGSNLMETIDSVVASLDGATSMTEVAEALARGSLMGAVGHSGGILSQILRGFSDAVSAHSEIDAAGLSKALGMAVSAGYEAVDEPTEGTMLTILRESAQAAEEAGAETDLAQMAASVYQRGVETLQDTRVMLPELSDAGVVDAGGAGLVMFLAAVAEVISGSEIELPEDLLNATPRSEGPTSDGGGPRYEVMFFLEAEDKEIPGFRRAWSRVGESVVVVGGDRLWNCHIHTDSIGETIEAGLEVGRPRGIKVTDLREQVGLLEADVAAGGFSPLPLVLDARIGVVSVSSGPGLAEKFRRLGVQHVVAAGPESVPTSADILAAVENASADTVVILPNHKSLVPVAEEVDALTTKLVAVVPTRSPIQGLAAMLGYYPGAEDVNELLEDMAAAAGAVDFGEVVRATRDAKVDGWEIHQGDWLGVADGRVVVVDPDRFATLRGLVAAIMPPSAEVVTVYSGDGAVASDTKALEAWVGETHPRVEVITASGGQASAPYLVSVE